MQMQAAQMQAAGRGAMPAAMRQTLELQRVEIGGSLASLEHHHAGILSTVTGVDVYLCIVTIGVMATVYTVLGGMEAVVWTDVLQVFVLVGGLFVALILAVEGAGGMEPAIDIALASGKLRWFAPGTSWTETASWSVLLGAMFLQFGPYTTDQAVVQRYCRLPAASDCSDLDTEMSERRRLSPRPASQRPHQTASAPWPASLLPLAVVSKYKVRISPRMTT